MKRSFSYVLILSVVVLGGAAVLVGGCTKNKPKKPSDDFANTPMTPPAPAVTSMSLRDALLASDPTLKVGIVNQVDMRAMTASASVSQDGDFKVDDSVAIIDLSQQPVANGIVTGAAAGGATVRYTVITGGRPPRDGDLVLRFAK